jgi:hypothetical protein
MKLWNLPNCSYFTIDGGLQVPPGAPPVDCDTVYWLGNIDGMFSYCTAPDGTVVHVRADADVTPQPNPKEQA